MCTPATEGPESTPESRAGHSELMSACGIPKNDPYFPCASDWGMCTLCGRFETPEAMQHYIDTGSTFYPPRRKDDR